MLEGLLNGLLAFAVLIGAAFVWGAISDRLPPPRKRPVTKPYEAKRFGVWSTVNDFDVAEFRIGYVSGWECGHELNIYANGTVEIGDETFEKKRVSATLYGYRDAYASNIIGWGKDHEKYIELRLSLSDHHVAAILNELRLAGQNKPSLHVHGWQDEKGLKVEYFRLAPSLD